MKLTINGDINRTYCENLCLIFFPGEKFPAVSDSEKRSAVVNVCESDGSVNAECTLDNGAKCSSGFGKADASSERAAKIAVGKAFYEAGTALNGFPPPWGILTGVRPAKISNSLLSSVVSYDGVISRLMDDYLVSEQKARLLADVSISERKAFALAAENTCSLYVSIPFCPTRCAYCSFVSYSTPRYLSLIPQYLEALKTDIEIKAKEAYGSGKKIITIYIGGGTPTVLSAGQLDFLLSTVEKNVNMSDIIEFTVEAGRPDTITEDKLKALVAHGVDRISINPQILDDGILHTIGRNHTVKDFLDKYELARKYPFKAVNTDLIAGLPGSDSVIFEDTLNGIISLDPENVTVHTFCVKNSARIKEEAGGSGFELYSFNDSETEKSVSLSQSMLKDSGYLPYYLYRQKNARGNLENVGFAKEGRECLYNIFIMEELHSIYAAGAGAVTKIVGAPGEKITRIFNPKYTYEYLDRKVEI